MVGFGVPFGDGPRPGDWGVFACPLTWLCGGVEDLVIPFTGGKDVGGSARRGSAMEADCNALCAIACCSAMIRAWAMRGLGFG